MVLLFGDSGAEDKHFSSHLFFQSGKEGIQLFAFDVGGGSDNDVAGGASVGVLTTKYTKHTKMNNS